MLADIENRAERLRWASVAAAVFLGIIFYAALPATVRQSRFIAELIALIRYHIWKPLHEGTVYWLLTAEFGTVLAGVLILQFLLPARAGQKVFSPHVLTDVVWFFYAHVMNTLVLVTYVVWVSTGLQSHFAGMQLRAMDAWPAWLRFLAIFLFVDFMAWLQHYLLHKIPFLWPFHAVHHSQTELNFFSDFRIHFVEYPWRTTFKVVPLLVFHVAVPAIVGFALFERWYSRIYHSNLKLNLGPLKYVLVTPQSHRFHHIRDPRWRDMNFGSLLSIWDGVFGTRAKEWNTYPETGIDDVVFPMESRRFSVGIIWLPIVQQLYPAAELARAAWDRFGVVLRGRAGL